MTETLTLGTAEELPADYRARLTELSVVPAWTLLRAVMPVGKPVNQARATHWSYRALRTELLRAAELVPVEKAERRVLAFVNPGLATEQMATLPSIFFGERAEPLLGWPAARIFANRTWAPGFEPRLHASKFASATSQGSKRLKRMRST